MRALEHAVIGVLSSFAIVTLLNVDLGIVTINQALLIRTIGGLLPDIDHVNSKLGRRIPILPNLLTHRGLTHTVYFITVCVFFIFNVIGCCIVFVEQSQAISWGIWSCL